MTQEKRKKGWRMNCDVVAYCSFFNLSVTSPTSQLILQPFRRLELILQPFRHFTYVTTNSPTLPSLYLCHSSSQTLPLFYLCHSLLILQPFCHFTYITTHSQTLLLFYLCHNSFSNPSFASPTSQALCLIHLASRPCL